MDGDLSLDLPAVLASIDRAEALSIFFPAFRKAVVVDTRFNGTDGPMVRIMPMAASPQGRLRSLRRLRPGFPRPLDLTFIPWMRYVGSLASLGVWERVVQRVVASGYPGMEETCRAVLGELRRLEKAELEAVVRGDSYHTLWRRQT